MLTRRTFFKNIIGLASLVLCRKKREVETPSETWTSYDVKDGLVDCWVYNDGEMIQIDKNKEDWLEQIKTIKPLTEAEIKAWKTIDKIWFGEQL